MLRVEYERRKKMKVKLLLVVLLALFFVTQSDAQYRERSTRSESSIGIGPQVGYHRAGDADDGRFMFGAFIRAKLSQAFALEGSINYRQEEYYGGRVEVSNWPVLVSALIYPFPAVYGIAGVGWYFTTVGFDNSTFEQDLDDRTTNPFGFHLGAGLELPLGEMLKLTGDIKYVFLNYDLEDVGDVALNDLNSNFYIISVGLAFGLR
jgi:opacity protein-like surface antigen